ncbi:hypothetical protein BMR1_03g02510 [Babesia microti strain RI]|uniref:Uncharacterized protein n=1 Tax=Babesia microti (strain RI) TaxID=1133968 RepID=A0A1R4ABS3_BABMR|nr:hypothetical protein BMR1_03g02510 [Babesia microti strain RI]SJK86467.1 hypothetical protein BMR1_03g02510 [Babesia microti strain RI]|eukprot:XP_021338624.1 hypothetical protein BMR1_03g02510 [Babesia microti strain RI]
MDREIHKLNQLVSLMPYRNDKNRTDGVNVGSGLPCTSLEEVNLLTKISEYFVKLTGEVLSENFLNGDLGIGGVKRVRKEDRFDRNIHMARLELKKLDAQIEKRKRELRKINGQIKAAKMDRISLLGRITLYQQQLILMAQAKDAIEAIKKEKFDQGRVLAESDDVEISDYIA